MQLPDVQVPAQFVIDEYYAKYAALTGSYIHLKGVVAEVVKQRDAALRRVAELEEHIRGWQGAEEETLQIGESPRV